MSRAKDIATTFGVALGILVWVALAVVGLALPVLAAIYLVQHI